MSAGRAVRAVRGATTIERDDPALMEEATIELVSEIMRRNTLVGTDVLSAIFTLTPDLRSGIPSRVPRSLGWDNVPLIITSEIPVPGALPHCIRVLLHVDTDGSVKRLAPVYLGRAIALRPDLASYAEK